MKRTAIALTLILTLLMLLVAGVLFANLSSANFFPDPGPDLPRIYIRSNGNVEPATAPIERAGNLYKLTGNIVLYTIEIQRDNIVLDGAGYTIQGNASRIKGYDDGNNGVIVAGRNNVTITHLNFEQGETGIRISGSSNISVIDNSFSNGIRTGIEVQDSMFVLIEANNFTDLNTDLNAPAVMLNGLKNTFRNNTLIGSTYGITIEGSSTVISDNKIESVLPIILENADLNTIANNSITGPMPSLLFPNQTYTGNEGIALFVNCSNNIIIGNTITGFVNQAIRIAFDGSNNTIYGNYFANNQFAIAIGGWGDFVPVNNIFYGNTFAEDSCNIQISDRDCNFWDNGTIGNYWGDYNGTDSNGDGIGDSAYIVNGFKWDTDVDGFVSFVAGQDNYPLMAPFEIPSASTPSPEPQLESEPFPTVVVATVSGVSAAVIGLGLLVYFKKRKH
jgi:parallel beta-helix repeat protein